MMEGTRKPVRYAITDLAAQIAAQQFDAAEQRRMRLEDALLRWSTEAVDIVQLREKTLDAGEICALAENAMKLLGSHEQSAGTRPKLLINGRPDLAAAARADGVHLTGRPGELRPAQAREVCRAAGLKSCTISMSCHTLEDVVAATQGGADLILFGPVFGKVVGGVEVSQALGLPALEKAVQAAGGVPVLALGGITSDRIEACLRTGAAGIAAIRLFR